MRPWLCVVLGLVMVVPGATASCHWDNYRCALDYGLQLVSAPSMQASDSGEGVGAMHVRMAAHDGADPNPGILLLRPGQVNLLQVELDNGPAGPLPLREVEMRLRVDGVVVTGVDERTDPWHAEVLSSHALPRQTGIVFLAGGALSPGWHPLDVGLWIRAEGGEDSLVRTIYACVPPTDFDPTLNATLAQAGPCAEDGPAADLRVQSYADWVKTLPVGDNGLQPGLTESTPGVAVAALAAGLLAMALVLRRRT